MQYSKTEDIFSLSICWYIIFGYVFAPHHSLCPLSLPWIALCRLDISRNIFMVFFFGDDSWEIRACGIFFFQITFYFVVVCTMLNILHSFHHNPSSNFTTILFDAPTISFDSHICETMMVTTWILYFITIVCVYDMVWDNLHKCMCWINFFSLLIRSCFFVMCFFCYFIFHSVDSYFIHGFDLITIKYMFEGFFCRRKIQIDIGIFIFVCLITIWIFYNLINWNSFFFYYIFIFLAQD